MVELHSVSSLEIDQDLDAQRREWRIGKIAWIVFVLVLAAGLAGVFGSGPLARAETGDAELSIEYERFARRLSPGRLRIHARTGREREFALWIDRSYLESLEVRDVTPAPESVKSDGEHVIYFFRTAGDGERLRVDVCFEHTSPGQLTGRVGSAGGSEAEFRQLVYP